MVKKLSAILRVMLKVRLERKMRERRKRKIRSIKKMGKRKI